MVVRGIAVFLAIIMVSIPAVAKIPVFGVSGSPKDGWHELWAYIGPGVRGKDIGIANCQSSNRDGGWTMWLDKPGTYAGMIFDAYGFGPALRPGIIITEKGFNRVNLCLPFQYDISGKPAETESKEYGQTFKAEGTSITGISFDNSNDVEISMYEGGPLGRQVGKTVPVSDFYRHGTLPTKPGKTYYIRFRRMDGASFKMPIAEGNPYPEGEAYIEGKPQEGLDLAFRIQYDPSGIIYSHKPRGSELYGWAKESYGQTFTARGTSLAMLVTGVAYGDKPYQNPTIRILEGGPGGKQVGPTIKDYLIVLNPGDIPLTPGKKYYIEVSEPTPPAGLNMWVETSDVIPDGELYFEGEPVPGRDLAIRLVEYEKDTVPPPPPTNVKNIPGDGKMKVVWDVPLSNDISKVVVRRMELPRRDPKDKGQIIAEIPTACQGRFYCLDTGLKNGRGYLYSICTVDAAGNESVAAEGTGTPCAGLPLPAELLNGDFDAPHDFLMPFGWMAKSLNGVLTNLYMDRDDNDPKANKAAGWSSGGAWDFVLCQRVPCEKGRRYQFSADTWRRDPWNNDNANALTLIGMDPTGGDDPLSKSVLWTQPIYKSNEWVPQSVTAVAQSDYITVYLRGYAQYGGFTDARFDNAKIIDVTTASE